MDACDSAGSSARDQTQDNPLLCRQLLEEFEILELLGEGTYGMVYKGRNKLTNEITAIKLLRYDQHCERFALAPSVVREVTILKRCQHPNIVELLEVRGYPPYHMTLHFELMRSDLRMYIRNTVVAQKANRLNCTTHYGLAMKTVKRFTLQLLMAIRTAHCQNILHRDLKPQNVLVNDAADTVKIADWGLSRPLKPRHSHSLLTREVVTLWYRSPELLLGCQKYDGAVDMWSIGVIIYHMVTGLPLIHCPTAITTLIAIFHLFGTPKDPFLFDLPFFSIDLPQWPLRDRRTVLKDLLSCHPESDEDLADLLSHLLALNPNERWTARQAIWHPFLDDVRNEHLAKEKRRLAEEAASKPKETNRRKNKRMTKVY